MDVDNYSSGDDIVVEFLRLRFSFNAPDFAQRVTAAAFKLGLVVLWTKVGWEALQRHKRPWLVATVAVAVLVLLVALSLLGVKLPREGG